MAKHKERGTQVSLVLPQKHSGLAFHFPEDPPVTDEDILDREELIARIGTFLEPLRDLIGRGNGYCRAIRRDIDKCMADRLKEPRQNPLFEDVDTSDAATRIGPKKGDAPTEAATETASTGTESTGELRNLAGDPGSNGNGAAPAKKKRSAKKATAAGDPPSRNGTPPKKKSRKPAAKKRRAAAVPTAG